VPCYPTIGWLTRWFTRRAATGILPAPLRLAPLLLATMILPGRAARAQTAVPSRAADSASVIGVAARMLAAISARDTAAARPLLMPGALFVAIADPAGGTGGASLTTDTDFYRTLPQGTERYLERMWSPTVILHGSLAEVHTPYDFYRDGVFSHCGTDVFTLVRQRGTWMIAALSYTRQRTGCAPSPLGPPA
jgi:hypothetical protein